MRREVTPIGIVYMGDIPIMEIHVMGLQRTRNMPPRNGRTAWNDYARGIASFYGLPGNLEGNYAITAINSYTTLSYSPTQEDWLSGLFTQQDQPCTKTPPAG